MHHILESLLGVLHSKIAEPNTAFPERREVRVCNARNKVFRSIANARRNDTVTIHGCFRQDRASHAGKDTVLQ